MRPGHSKFVGDRPLMSVAKRSGGDEVHGAAAKRQRILRQIFPTSGSGQVGEEHGQAAYSKHGEGEHDEAGASHGDGRERVESGAAEHCDGIEVDEHPATTSTELFVHDREEERVLLDWLRERP